MSPEKLAYMANQIGKFFAHRPPDVAVAAIADHITRFWDPRMRREILANRATVNLDPSVRQAVDQLHESGQK
jgi:formate dehydrogenase subunit delta